ncbi:MAG TPA: hypothetical protein VFE31_08880 [Opitutaceae bacterium]|jgi:hypothetical protein|nr:hypothetical protein [Opitutaceae bacterium]
MTERSSSQLPLMPFGLPVLYFNGFQSSIAAVDMSLTLMNNDRPIADLRIAYPVAKSLVKALGASIAEYEKSVGTSVQASDELIQKLNAAFPGGEKK